MSAQPGPDGQELRARHYLRRLGARPFGHQEPPMHEPDRRPVTPTRIIPAGTPLPARPPERGELPPWREKPAPPPPATPPAPVRNDPDPGLVEVRHTHEITLTWADPDPEPDPPLWARVWDWLWERLFTWRMIVAILAALAPWAGGQSPVGLWSGTVHQARTEAGILAAYVIAGVAIAATWALDRRTGRALPRFLLVTASLGAVGVLHWWDPILFLTGVPR
ncbi:hypothetical protein ACIQ6R_13240 [Streptomyces sp. NPDC096048]|uniref:hypothetical protein n=1 Tax=Streptomyces sp. NPDC096048 TaxID=3366072 RepID=UPI00381F29CE